MRSLFLLLAALALAGSTRSAVAQSEKPLDIQFIDVEGGQATLIVSPSGESLLVDTGYPGFNGRDADRIAAAVKQAGLSRIDYLVITHYHADHVGGVPALAARVPIRTFVDHGPTVEQGDNPARLYNAYLETRAKGRHVLARPGDTLPVAGLDVRFVSGRGRSDHQAAAGRRRGEPALPRLQAGRRRSRPRTRARSAWSSPSAASACSTSAISRGTRSTSWSARTTCSARSISI